ncbi:putative ring finger domain protein [Erysiphe necator]|uniref:Putative ring finger domain protein n=1 Tax=Uncinula necator TaxID=52586 RepID=A0A0B1PF57_UNCNE|nr:putative ring finger domain protein [Erysiphe necator]
MLHSIFVLLLVSIIITSAQYIGATNDTLPEQETKSAFLLRLNGGALLEEKSYVVVPLTVAAGKGQSAVAIATYNIQGNFNIDYPVGNLTSSDIVFISCDSTNAVGNATEIVKNAAAQNPQAIVLFSYNSDACNHSGDFNYQSIYSLTTNGDTNDLISIASSPSELNDPIRAIISPNTSNGIGTPVMDTNNEGGPAPTTAVAMSILYSITGIITLLFLIIIATGAIRAHRHPERYGPRNTAFPGRPVQSRAKGLARAMLETLPIVKFENPKSTKDGDDMKCIENSLNASSEGLQDLSGRMEEGKTKKVDPIQKGPIESNYEIQEADLGCSICTEDFIAGEYLRVLPCNHKYHPVCIDPWLLDVCGTCPLCRHDLRPISPDSSGIVVAEGLPPPLSAIDEERYHSDNQEYNSRRNKITRFFDLTRLRQAPPDESIAALRQLRQQTQPYIESTNTADIEERNRSSRLTERLKDTFRIRTRTQPAGLLSG